MLVRNEIDHARTALRVAIGAQDTFGFMQCVVNGSMLFEQLAIDADRGAGQIDFDSDLRDDLAVDFDAALLDQFVDLASGSESRSCENFVDALHRWFSIGLIGWLGIRSVFLLQVLFLGGFCWASFSR